MAYVGLYHKIENYENCILKCYNSLAKTNHKTLDNIGIDLNKKELFSDRNRIRLICNSIKHNDCFPKKELKDYYPYLQLDEKINISLLNFKSDIELIILYTHLFNVIISLHLSKTFLKSIENLLPEAEGCEEELNDLLEFFTKDESYKTEEFEKKYLKE